MSPLLSHTDTFQKNTGLQGLPENCQQPTDFGSTLYLDLLPQPFPCLAMNARQQGFKIEVFLSLNGLSSWAVEIYLTETADYKAPAVRLCLFSGFEMNLFVRGI